jgi:hypothetical protein
VLPPFETISRLAPFEAISRLSPFEAISRLSAPRKLIADSLGFVRVY